MAIVKGEDATYVVLLFHPINLLKQDTGIVKLSLVCAERELLGMTMMMMRRLLQTNQHLCGGGNAAYIYIFDDSKHHCWGGGGNEVRRELIWGGIGVLSHSIFKNVTKITVLG